MGILEALIFAAIMAAVVGPPVAVGVAAGSAVNKTVDYLSPPPPPPSQDPPKRVVMVEVGGGLYKVDVTDFTSSTGEVVVDWVLDSEGGHAVFTAAEAEISEISGYLKIFDRLPPGQQQEVVEQMVDVIGRREAEIRATPSRQIEPVS